MADEAPPQAIPPIKPFVYPELDSEPLHRWSGADITDDQLRAISLGAVLSYTWGPAYEDALTLSTPDMDKKESAIEGLHESWGVTSPDGLLDTVRTAHSGMHAPVYAAVHPLVMEALDSGGRHNAPDTLPARHRQFLHDYARSRGESDDSYSRYYDLWLQAHRLDLVQHVPEPLSASIVGWDVCRAAWLVRAGYTAGYIADEQAWALLATGLSIAKARFRNWRQVGDSYLTGHAFWSALDLSDFEEQTKTRRHWMLRHWDRPGSAWRKLPLHPGDPTY